MKLSTFSYQPSVERADWHSAPEEARLYGNYHLRDLAYQSAERIAGDRISGMWKVLATLLLFGSTLPPVAQGGGVDHVIVYKQQRKLVLLSQGKEAGGKMALGGGGRGAGVGGGDGNPGRSVCVGCEESEQSVL